MAGIRCPSAVGIERGERHASLISIGRIAEAPGVEPSGAIDFSGEEGR